MIESYQHTDEFAHDLTMVIVQSLQISNKLDVGGFKAGEHLGGVGSRRPNLAAAEAQPFSWHAQPLGKRAQLFLRWNRLSDNPFTGCMHRNWSAVKANVKFPCQSGRAVWGVMGIFKSRLQALAKTFPFGG